MLAATATKNAIAGTVAYQPQGGTKGTSRPETNRSPFTTTYDVGRARHNETTPARTPITAASTIRIDSIPSRPTQIRPGLFENEQREITVFVIDKSGSMSEKYSGQFSKLEVAKSAVKGHDAPKFRYNSNPESTNEAGATTTRRDRKYQPRMGKAAIARQLHLRQAKSELRTLSDSATTVTRDRCVGGCPSIHCLRSTHRSGYAQPQRALDLNRRSDGP